MDYSGFQVLCHNIFDEKMRNAVIKTRLKTFGKYSEEWFSTAEDMFKKNVWIPITFANQSVIKLLSLEEDKPIVLATDSPRKTMFRQKSLQEFWLNIRKNIRHWVR
jgi:hypothetical protein